MKLPINLAVAPIVLGVISRANAAATVQPSNAYSGLSQQGISSFFGYPEKLVYIDDNSFLQVSQDGGSNWKTAIEDTNVAWVVTHPYDGLIGYVCDKEKSSLYLTQDSGRSFYELENCPQNIEGLRLSTIDPSYLMISSEGPDSAKDESSQTFDYYATTNSLDSSSSLTLVMEAAQDCQWVRSLSTSNDLLQASSIICVKDEQLVITHDLGETIEYVQVDGEPLRNVVSLFQESNFVLAVTGADSEHQKDSTYNIITTSNWSTWSRAELSDDSKPTELTCLLPSTKNSAHLYIPAVTDNSDSGIFLTSDASGIHFSKRLEGVQKVVRAANKYFDDILVASFSSTASKISYDDGRTWNSIVTDCESDDVSDGYSSCKDLYFLLSDNSGSSLVSPSPGIIAGLASPQLPATEDSVHLYLSDDFGRTWNMVRYSSHHFTFINSGYTLVAAPKTDHITEIYYTHDFGTWNSIHLDVPTKVLSIKSLDSAGVIIEGSFNQDEVSTIKIDFHDQYERDCKKEDFQLTSVTRMASAGISDKNVEKDCIMGAKGSFYRLRFNTICQIIDDAEPYHTITHEFCTCVTADYECSGNSVYDFSSGECNPIISLEEFTDQCNKDPSSEYPSIYSKIPGNKCSIEKGVDIAASTRCDNVYTIQENVDNNDDSKVKAELHKFDGDIIDYFYPKTSDENPEDEVIIVRTNYEKVYITHDQGGEWKQILEDTSVISAIPNPYFPDIMYFFTPSDQIYYTTDRAKTFNHFKVPLSLSHSAVMPLSFSREDPHKVIFIGENGCDNPFSSKCTLSAYYSTDYGKSWDILENDVRECNWISGLTQKTDPNLILCDKLVDGGRKVDLIASKDFFSNKETIFENIVGFALENEFIIVAKIGEGGSELEAYVSVDGSNYAEAKFPYNFHVDHKQAYTILASITNSIFLHVTVSNRQGGEYGTILKSNSNGTDYVISLEEVNRNAIGFVDFEKMEGLEGVALANIVSNADEAKNGARKKLKTVITHNDGAQWMFLTPPDVDSEGKGIDCNGNLNKCSLNLHGYTERKDFRDSYSSTSAVGLMIGVGNVGESLSDMKDGNTYLTRDGGIHWREIKKGAYMWEYGDSGSIIVLVNGHDPTNIMSYSLDEGATWNDFQFSDDLIHIEDIATIPSDTSRKFVLFGKLPAKEGAKSCSIQIDFSQLLSRKCKFEYDDSNGGEMDFETWIPSHPALDNDCLFGHVAVYHRKIPGRDCYIGRNIGKPHMIERNCTCARQDFECDFNYQIINDGSCQLVPGYNPPDHSLSCIEMPGQIEYWEPTGYRRIPISTCQGGNELDKIVSHPCPGKEKDYDEKHRGLHGFALFIVIMLPIGMALVVGVIVWDHYSKRYGQIRLGEEDDDQPAPLRYAVIGVAGVIAFLSVIPGFFKTLYVHILNKVRSTRYTSRTSLQRNLRYSSVDVDEGELLRASEDEEDEDEEDDIDNVI